ncbi:hypothetical protein GCM10009504_33350 [Pseudomonas laurentiana]|nr:hypothetical protein GCM10009504_33350 [Pseudomonas laurentiana]
MRRRQVGQLAHLVTRASADLDYPVGALSALHLVMRAPMPILIALNSDYHSAYWRGGQGE